MPNGGPTPGRGDDPGTRPGHGPSGGPGSGASGSGSGSSGEEPRVVVRDRRRIDPQTGQVRPPVVDTESTPSTQSTPGEPPAGRHAATDTAAAADSDTVVKE